MDSTEENNPSTTDQHNTNQTPPRELESDVSTTTPKDNKRLQSPPSASKSSSACSSASPTLPPPALFVNALNLQPNGGRTDTGTKEAAASDDDSSLENEKMDATHTVTLTSKFKEDPGAVLKLLQAALPMEKLSSLIKSECRGDKKKLKNLQQQLEEAYVTLSESSTQKNELHEKIRESQEKIGSKRKQMEEIREDLRVLGEEELQLKKKRDASYAKCSEIKKKLKSSREAQQQIAAFSSKTNSTVTTTT